MSDRGDDAYVPLHDDWLSQRLLKRALIEKAAYQLSEVQSYCLDSALARGDLARAKQMIADWTPMEQRPGAYVSKWVPGEHYYALDAKFTTFDEARAHLEQQGYQYLGFKSVRASDFYR